MSHCPYLLHKFVINSVFVWLLFCVPHLLELPTALLEYLDLLLGDCSPPAPQGCYTYMIMIIKMIEIYNIAAQPYYCWWTHAYYIETIAAHTLLTYSSSKRRRFITMQLCLTRYSAVWINNCSKRTFVIKVATIQTISVTNGRHHVQSTLFVVNKDEW